MITEIELNSAADLWSYFHAGKYRVDQPSRGEVLEAIKALEAQGEHTADGLVDLSLVWIELAFAGVGEANE